MTRPHRRDFGVKSASVISGLRLERDVAQKLCEAARQRTSDPTAAKRRDRLGDVAVMARHFIRVGLGIPESRSAAMEATEVKPARLAGLALESGVYQALEGAHSQLGSITATARHFIRRGLGYAEAESLRREERFAALAQALRDARETT